MTATLIILSGLPGTGKTTIAREPARQLGAVHLRIDTIEQSLRNAGVQGEVGDEGYRVAYAVAEDNLRLGLNVIADSVNPLAVTREAWHAVAQRAGVPHLDVEVVCSDIEEHRHRVETRDTDICGLELPSWQAVLEREYEAWQEEHLVLDTASVSVERCVVSIRKALGR